MNKVAAGSEVKYYLPAASAANRSKIKRDFTAICSLIHSSELSCTSAHHASLTPNSALLSTQHEHLNRSCMAGKAAFVLCNQAQKVLMAHLSDDSHPADSAWEHNTGGHPCCDADKLRVVPASGILVMAVLGHSQLLLIALMVD